MVIGDWGLGKDCINDCGQGIGVWQNEKFVTAQPSASAGGFNPRLGSGSRLKAASSPLERAWQFQPVDKSTGDAVQDILAEQLQKFAVLLHFPRGTGGNTLS
jgi:hypothetical protein